MLNNFGENFELTDGSEGNAICHAVDTFNRMLGCEDFFGPHKRNTDAVNLWCVAKVMKADIDDLATKIMTKLLVEPGKKWIEENPGKPYFEWVDFVHANFEEGQNHLNRIDYYAGKWYEERGAKTLLYYGIPTPDERY